MGGDAGWSRGDAGVSRVGEVREVHHRAVDRRVEELAAVERRGRGAERRGALAEKRHHLGVLLSVGEGVRARRDQGVTPRVRDVRRGGGVPREPRERARANRARVVARWEGTSAWGSPAEAPRASRGAVLPRRTSVTQRAHTVPTPRALYTQRCPWARVTWSAGSIAPKGADSDRQARGAARAEQRLEREGYTVHGRVSFGAARRSANLPARNSLGGGGVVESGVRQFLLTLATAASTRPDATRAPSDLDPAGASAPARSSLSSRSRCRSRTWSAACGCSPPTSSASFASPRRRGAPRWTRWR